jgi:hypothetical protein
MGGLGLDGNVHSSQEEQTMSPDEETERIILDKMAHEVKVEPIALLCGAEILISTYLLHKSPSLVLS